MIIYLLFDTIEQKQNAVGEIKHALVMDKIIVPVKNQSDFNEEVLITYGYNHLGNKINSL